MNRKITKTLPLALVGTLLFQHATSAGELALAAATPPANELERDSLTGDWGGGRTWLGENGITLLPRLTQFYQGLSSGSGDHGYEYGGKLDLLLNANLQQLGLWDGFYMVVHAESNYGASANGRGGILLPVNTALFLPGSDGAEAFDLTSVFFAQKLGDSVSVMAGKLNAVDIAAGTPFMGGAGIDAFENVAFVAPPSGILPPYIFGGILNIRTKPAAFTLMIYDPLNSNFSP